MWLVVLPFLAAQALSTLPEPPCLIVQIVDPYWLPIPGAEVTVRPLTRKGAPKVAHTDNDGNAKFRIQGDADYALEATLRGFKTKRLKHAHLGKPTTTFPTAYIQLRLQPSGPFITVN
jgi:hypothetical protein